MQSAQLLHHLVPGAHMQMVGVGELHLGPYLLQIGCGHRPFDGGRGSHVHEHRGLNRAVDRHKLCALRPSFLL